MSWDLTVINVVDGSKSIDELKENSIGKLGTKRSVVRKLKEIFPGIDTSDPDWFVFREGRYSLEFSLGSDEGQVDSFMIHVHGDDEQVVRALAALCDRTGWSVLDAATGDLIDFQMDSGKEGYLKWKKYKHHLQEKGWHE